MEVSLCASSTRFRSSPRVGEREGLDLLGYCWSSIRLLWLKSGRLSLGKKPSPCDMFGCPKPDISECSVCSCTTLLQKIYREGGGRGQYVWCIKRPTMVWSIKQVRKVVQSSKKKTHSSTELIIHTRYQTILFYIYIYII